MLLRLERESREEEEVVLMRGSLKDEADESDWETSSDPLCCCC